jgi:hypothetical protein
LKHARLSRAVGLTVIITAPLAAAATWGVGRLRRRPARRIALVAEYGIRNVPATPPLWRQAARPHAGDLVGYDAVAAVPPQDPHAPPTPPTGIPRQSA